jgi:uncharacterized protein (DUF1684 family)
VAEPLDSDYVAKIEAWKSRRDESLRQPDGWLTLVGLFWLEEGTNSFGPDTANDVIFPSGTLSSLGEFQLEDGAVTIRATEDSGIEYAGESVTEMVLQPDVSGAPTILELGSLTFYAIERAERVGIRVKDSQSEALAEFSGMEYFPLDPAWRVDARFEAFDEPRTLMVPNVIGSAFEEPVQGTVSFEVDGQSFELTPVGEAGKPLLFVFGDSTNGAETYGGGRFLVADWPGEDGFVTLDFNRAYNPPCVFSPFATCPLPVESNKLDLAVLAGEKSFGAGH